MKPKVKARQNRDRHIEKSVARILDQITLDRGAKFKPGTRFLKRGGIFDRWGGGVDDQPESFEVPFLDLRKGVAVLVHRGEVGTVIWAADEFPIHIHGDFLDGHGQKIRSDPLRLQVAGYNEDGVIVATFENELAADLCEKL